MGNKIQIKRGLKAALPILVRGELGYATDTNELFIGVLAEPTSPTDNVLVNVIPDLSPYATISFVQDEIDAAALALGTNYAVADIAARDNLEDLVVGDMVFVVDDGDSQWAQYKVTGIGPVVFTKIMDQDVLINAIDGPGIKSAYESNADTNAFTDALLTKLNTTDIFDDAGTYANLRAQATTKADVGLTSVEDYGVASQAEAEAGSVNNKYMTPLRTAEAIAELAPTPEIATQAEAEAGSINDKFMTPLRTSEAIAELAPTPEIATKEEAEAGSINDKFMTPLRTSEAIAELVEFDFGVWELPPGPQTLIASTTSTNPLTNEEETAGFFGLVSQEDFGRTMTEIMSDLGISEGTAQNTNDPLLKFRHRGKIKYINQKSISYLISWDHIQERLVANGGNVYDGATLTFGGHSYKVRLMRGWGQVSANTNGTGAPDYENGPLMTISFATFPADDNGSNWPTNTSPWNAASPNEWNTLIFPIHANSGTQTQTDSTPDWASYSNQDLGIDFSSATFRRSATWVQETSNTSTSKRLLRGWFGLDHIHDETKSSITDAWTLRFVFELVTE